MMSWGLGQSLMSVCYHGTFTDIGRGVGFHEACFWFIDLYDLLVFLMYVR